MAEFTLALTEGGFRVQHFTVHGSEIPSFTTEDLEACSAIVVDIHLANFHLFLELSYLIGRGKNLWIICDDADKLPEVLKKASFISSKEIDKGHRLVKQIREQLNIQIPKYEPVGDLTSLVSWIAQEPKRITDLSSKDFETFVVLLLSKLGLQHNTDLTTSSGGDIVFSDPTTSTLFLVESKNYVSGHLVGVGEIERCVTNAMNLHCDFSVLVSANDFTRSAKEYAKLCAPPVWLLSRENLEFLIGSDLGATAKLKERAKGLFKWIISKRDSVSDIRNESLFIQPTNSVHLPYAQLHDPIRVEFIRRGLKHRPSAQACEVFLAFGKQEQSQKMTQQILKLARDLDDSGIRVSHNSPSLDVGRACLKLPEVASAIKRSHIILYFFGSDTEPSMTAMKTLQIVALQISQSPYNQMIVFVVGNDNPWNRLRLPSIFSESTFLNPHESEWGSEIVNFCQRLTDLK